jgi:predicted ribosomally synthesized peptide with SipW-like signal peptide
MRNKKSKIKALAVSALVAFATVGVGVGGTFALFTDSDQAQVSVTAGKVDIASAIVAPTLKSALADEDGTFQDENGAKYSFQDGWVNGGTATVDSDTGEVTLTNMTPGDKAELEATMTNSSNVKIKYRFVITADDSTSELAKVMTVTIGDASYAGLLTYRSAWTALEPGVSPTDPAAISFLLPMDKGNDYQNLTTSYHITFEAVQANASVGGEATYELAA